MYDFLYQIANPIGIVGVILILIAYLFLSTGRWIPDSFKYQILNFIGAWLILYSLFFHWNVASFTIEVAWIIISVIGVYRAYRFSGKKKG
jgi:multisubunit Na+/H+ antiporter MnhB subunit